MSKFTADEVEKMASAYDERGFPFTTTTGMLRDLAARLRQEEEENRRDTVKEPRPGDRVQYKDGTFLVYCEESEDNPGGTTDLEFWRSQARHGASTVIRRREVQQ